MDNYEAVKYRAFYGYFILVFITIPCFAQKRYKVEKGEISFASNAELELIKASSAAVQGLIDPSTSQFAFTIDVKTFRGFNSELQREHFNEKYLESETFPKAKFSGKIIEQIDFTQDGVYEVRAKGDLEIHGEKQTRIIKGRITSKNGALTVDSRFIVPLDDHNITVPSIVRQKIATEIEVTFQASMILQ
jgi:polyisoprenoid-binding protein YceI